MVEKKVECEKINKLGIFLGCVIPTEQYAYELSLRKVIAELDIELIELEGASCCGAPFRSINLNLSMYLSLRNLAICSMADVDMLAPCPICHLALSEANNFIQEPESHAELARYKAMLEEEGLKLNGNVKLYHTLDLLNDVIGLDELAKHVVAPLDNIKFACHYGCHTIRPTQTVRPDSAEHPEKMENVLKVIGAQSKDYPERLNCCGGPLILNLQDSALTKTGQKLKAVQEHGFAGLVDMCPWGHRLFDSRQKNAADTVGEKLDIPVFYLTQLIGLAFGIHPNELGLNLNLSPIEKIESLNISTKPSDSAPDTAISNDAPGNPENTDSVVTSETPETTSADEPFSEGGD